MPRYWRVLFAAVLLGCGHSGTQVRREEGVNFSHYRRIGVPSFNDRRGQGQAIAEGIENTLQQLMYEPVDRKALEQLLLKYKPDQEFGLGIEAMESIRNQTHADALVLGRMAPDWSAAAITMVETSTGDPILHAVLKPKGKKKSFAGPDEVVKETLRVITSPD